MIKIKTAAQIEEMKKAGALSKMALRHVGAMVRPGVSTFELDQLAEQIIRMHGGKPAFKGYGGFPGTICASVNDQVVHGIPNPDVILRDGDILSVDTGAVVDGWVGDNAWTFYCGTPSAEAQTLCQVTRDCLIAGIKQAVPGNSIGDIGYAIQSLAESHGFGVLRDYVGYGHCHRAHDHLGLQSRFHGSGRLGGLYSRSPMCRPLREHHCHHRRWSCGSHLRRARRLVQSPRWLHVMSITHLLWSDYESFTASPIVL